MNTLSASLLTLLALLAPSMMTGAEPSLPFYAWAPTPVMGWNSWDCFATTVTEAQTNAQGDVMADKLKAYGWQYITVDIQWYEPKAQSFQYRKDADLVMDEWGRLLPAQNRFPSAADSLGFKALAGYLHSKGLKFGIHIMRGIPRQAVTKNTPIKGTSYRAADIADKGSTCPWNSDMYGVDMTKSGAQEYYDSVYQLIASWAVDLVKVDDLSRPYHKAEIEAIRKAIDKTGRPIVFSTSPGETPVAEGEHISQHANMWRISDDFWDTWKSLYEQFKRLNDWTPYRAPGHFPDADMLPLGAIRLAPGFGGPPHTRFTKDEQITMMSLWAIARSPLIIGGDLTKLDPFTLSLLTNPEVIAVNQASAGNRQVSRKDDLIVWVAEVPDSSDRYVALFNARNNDNSPVTVSFSELGLSGKVKARDLWKRQDLGEFSGEFSQTLPPHGAGLYRVSPVQ
jgi:alpha-galactosidase